MKNKLLVLLSACLLTWILPPCSSSAREKSSDVFNNCLATLQKNNAQLKRFVLDNGMICLIKEDRAAPVVSIQIWVGTGSIHEQEYLGAGLSHAIEHMIFKGTEKRGVGSIFGEINAAGGRVNAYTSFDRTVFLADLPAKNWKVGLDVLTDAVMHSTFPAKEWEKERNVILREIAMGKDDPDRVISKLLWRTAYSVHPYKFPVIGYKEIFETSSREDLTAFFHRNYVPDNMITVVAGDINAKEVETMIRSVFANFHRKARAPVILPREPAQISPRFERQTGPYKISRLEWAYHIVPLSHPDAPALDLLAAIVGYGQSSKLNRQIKEELKLAFSINAWSHTPKEPGVFGISAEFDPANEEKTVAAIQNEVNSWQNSHFTRDEIDKARRMLLSAELSALQTMSGQAGNYASGEFYAGDPRFSETYLKLLNEVTPARLKEVANKYFNKRTLVILSPDTETKEESTQQSKPAIIRPKKTVLSNGVPLIIREDRRLPFVHFCAVFGGGLLSENNTNYGITQLMSKLITKGTKKRTNTEIANTTESLGGFVSAFAGHNSFGLQAKCLSGDMDLFAEIMADCMLNSVFSEKEIDKEKEIQISQVKEQYERPFYVAQEALNKAVFADHPYHCSTLGKIETVSKINREDILKHYRNLTVSGNMTLAVFGDITEEDAVKLAEKYFTKLKQEPAPTLSRIRPNPKLPSRVSKREDVEQTILLAGFPGVDLKDPRCNALKILKDSLSGLSSDLGIKVREERGLAYYVGAYHRTGVDPGIYVLYAGTHEKAVGEVEKLFKEEMTRITTQGLRAEELQKAKDRITAAFDMSQQNNTGLAMECALNELYGLGYLHSYNSMDKINKISIKDVKKAAASILSTDKMAISIVLPKKNEEN
ncbi:M16 family metallopeptidase [Verrucomicrobiota bacterium]